MGRKKPFSGKAKKAQLKAKRAAKRSQGSSSKQRSPEESSEVFIKTGRKDVDRVVNAFGKSKFARCILHAEYIDVAANLSCASQIRTTTQNQNRLLLEKQVDAEDSESSTTIPTN